MINVLYVLIGLTILVGIAVTATLFCSVTWYLEARRYWQKPKSFIEYLKTKEFIDDVEVDMIALISILITVALVISWMIGYVIATAIMVS